MDILLTLLSSGLQALIVYWGYHLTVEPVQTPKQRRWYQMAFISVGIASVCLTVTQQWLNGREQAQLKAKVEGIGAGVEQVRAQTLQPPTIKIATTGPLPTFRLTERDFPNGQNDRPWFTVGGPFGGHQVRLDWNELDGIDAFAEVDVWASECGTSGAARARIFDLTTNEGVVEGPWVNPKPDETGNNNFQRCAIVPQRLKLPRAQGTHVYVLQASSEPSGLATARGEIVLERQRK
jgi:hypothetical protein